MSRVLIVTILFLLVGANASAGDWQGHETVEGDVKHIVNPEESMEGPVDLRVKEAWRCGEDVVIFGRIQNMVIDSKGRTYVLDEFVVPRNVDTVPSVVGVRDLFGVVGQLAQFPVEKPKVTRSIEAHRHRLRGRGRPIRFAPTRAHPCFLDHDALQ